MSDSFEPRFPDCQYNDGVACDPNTKDCSKCGWNPTVAQERLDKICQKRNGEDAIPAVQIYLPETVKIF